jgi:type II secretory pathway component PulF
LLRYFGAITWALPGFRRLSWRPHAASVLDGLALAVENQRPLPPCIASLAQKYPHPTISRQLDWVAQDMSAGVSCWDSLYRRGLVRRADRTLLEAAHRAGNLAWALGEVAQNQRRRWMYQVNLVANLFYPALVLLLGSLVLWVMLAFFTPLISLIKGLS